MIKRLIIATVLLILVAGGLVGFNFMRDQGIQQFFASMKPPAVAVSTHQVETGDWMPVIEAIGTVYAVRGVDLTVEASGIVKEIAFAANETVEAGDVLLRLDDAVQRANLEAARAQAALDQQTLDRAVELAERGVGTNVSLDSAQATAAASRAQVASLEAVLQQKQIIAPFGGTIGIPNVDLGQYLSPGTTVATLQDLSTLNADFTVPEREFANLVIGQDVLLGGEENRLSMRGRISGIDPRVDASTRLVRVRAEVTEPDGTLNPGQFIHVNVLLPKETDVIAVPQTAVVTSLYGDHVFAVRPVEGAENGETEARQVFVTTGRRSGDIVEIAEGLQPGDVVITAGQNRLSNGTAVTVNNGSGTGAGNAVQSGAQAAPDAPAPTDTAAAAPEQAADE